MRLRTPRAIIACLALPMTVATAPAVIQEPPADGAAPTRSVQFIPEPGTEFVIGDRSYGGVIEVAAHPDGAAVTERVEVDRYLAGVAEVPLSWPEAALQAQAVAARTYLAWSLRRGRTADGETYGFDICATTACQVYAGAGVVTRPDGERWQQAVDATRNQVLLYQGTPAQTLYSSSAGSRTRANQDVFGGAAVPYLQPVASPEAGVTPYERWSVQLDTEVVVHILRRAGYPVGAQVRAASVDRPDEGGGAAFLVVDSDAGRLSIPVTEVRMRVSEIGPRLYPGLLPGRRPDGVPWPQAILSYQFDVTLETDPAAVPTGPFPPLDLPQRGTITFSGEGWGHGVGMSQWGAYAMATAGAAYDDILSHYYGLAPVAAGDQLPDEVRVGLSSGQPVVELAATGGFELRVDGSPGGRYEAGEWSVRSSDGRLVVIPMADIHHLVRDLAVRLRSG